jgi:hypothetical protein
MAIIITLFTAEIAKGRLALMSIITGDKGGSIIALMISLILLCSGLISLEKMLQMLLLRTPQAFYKKYITGEHIIKDGFVMMQVTGRPRHRPDDLPLPALQRPPHPCEDAQGASPQERHLRSTRSTSPTGTSIRTAS